MQHIFVKMSLRIYLEISTTNHVFESAYNVFTRKINDSCSIEREISFIWKIRKCEIPVKNKDFGITWKKYEWINQWRHQQ